MNAVKKEPDRCWLFTRRGVLRRSIDVQFVHLLLCNNVVLGSSDGSISTKKKTKTRIDLKFMM